MHSATAHARCPAHVPAAAEMPSATAMALSESRPGEQGGQGCQDP
jgi:hypothetical protein